MVVETTGQRRRYLPGRISQVDPERESVFMSVVMQEVEDEGVCVCDIECAMDELGLISDLRLSTKLDSLCRNCNLTWERWTNRTIRFKGGNHAN